MGRCFRGHAVTSDKCVRCDLPVATQDDYDTIAEGGGDWLCWSKFGVVCEPVDWRARALNAEVTLARLRVACAPSPNMASTAQSASGITYQEDTP